jgi:hypothetical protein
VVNDLPVQLRHDEMERNAYNAAFYELGLRWYWDGDTYRQLLSRSASPEERIRHYLETRHPHLLKAYDANFLVDAIEQKKTLQRQRGGAGDAALSGHFDWAQTLGGELGA